MNKFTLIIIAIALSSSIIIGCGSTDSGEKTLEDILPNSSWYYPDLNNEEYETDYYIKLTFRDLNTTVESSQYTYPCGSTEGRNSYTVDYEILNDSEILFEYGGEDGTEINEVMSYSEEKIVVESNDPEVNAVVMYSSCDDSR